MRMRRGRARGALIGMALLGGLASCFSSRSPTGTDGLTGECRFSLGSGVQGTTVVAIRDFAFAPPEVRIRAGGAVTWVNCEPPGTEAHTSTADQGEWSSPLLAPGQVFTQMFPQPGRFTYHCTPHPFMTAAVVVE